MLCMEIASFLVLVLFQSKLQMILIILQEFCALVASLSHHHSLQPKCLQQLVLVTLAHNQIFLWQHVHITQSSSQIFSWHDCQVIQIVGVKTDNNIIIIMSTVIIIITVTILIALENTFFLQKLKGGGKHVEAHWLTPRGLNFCSYLCVNKFTPVY